MTTLELRKACKPLAEYASKLDQESIVITSNNRPVAALVSLKHADRESLSWSKSCVYGNYSSCPIRSQARKSLLAGSSKA
jgi:hypothetical protein